MHISRTVRSLSPNHVGLYKANTNTPSKLLTFSETNALECMVSFSHRQIVTLLESPLPKYWTQKIYQTHGTNKVQMIFLAGVYKLDKNGVLIVAPRCSRWLIVELKSRARKLVIRCLFWQFDSHLHRVDGVVYVWVCKMALKGTERSDKNPIITKTLCSVYLIAQNPHTCDEVHIQAKQSNEKSDALVIFGILFARDMSGRL